MSALLYNVRLLMVSPADSCAQRVEAQQLKPSQKQGNGGDTYVRRFQLAAVAQEEEARRHSGRH